MESEGEQAPPGQDGEWHEVSRKQKRQDHHRQGKLDIATNVWKVSRHGTVSFFFSEFPESHGAKEMLKAFTLYGEAIEVVIPPRRDRRGRRFGFVRFCNVGDPRVFAIQLDNIIFGAQKIHVNVPKFQREAKESVIFRSDQQQRPLQQQRKFENHGVLQQQQRPLHLDHSRGIRQEWRKKYDGDVRKKVEETNIGRKAYHQTKYDGPKIVYHRKNNISEVCYNASEEEIQSYKKMYVGTVKTPGSTYSVHEWFGMRGLFSIKTTPLGANKVLLEEMEEGIISDLINKAQDWIYDKFDDIRGWVPDEIDNERVVWIRCHGIPVHAWNDEFFASLARNFGEYLGVDESTRTKTFMDVARIRLRSKGYDVFNAMVTANINGSLFHIKLVEEWCGPLQWIESEKITNEAGDSGGSDDEGDDGPPLFTAEGGWEDDEFFEEVEETINGDEAETENEVESVVQKTLEVPNGGVHAPNDWVGEINEKNNDENKDGEIRNIMEGSAEVAAGNLLENGGVHQIIHVGVGEGNEVGIAGGSSKKGGCKKKEGHKKSIIRSGVGLEKRKKNGRKGRKKKKEAAQFHFEATPEGEKNIENEGVYSVASSQPRLVASGVVRNLQNQLTSSASLSSNAIGANSHVESVGDSGIMMGNIRYEKEMEKMQAEKLWSLAKEKLGVNTVGDDEIYIEKIREMEERDKVVKGPEGNKQNSK